MTGRTHYLENAHIVVTLDESTNNIILMYLMPPLYKSGLTVPPLYAEPLYINLTTFKNGQKTTLSAHSVESDAINIGLVNICTGQTLVEGCTNMYTDTHTGRSNVVHKKVEIR